jgi:rubrerythrin
MVQQLQVRELERDYVELWPTGSRAKGEFRCADCGYGIVVTAELPRCPMCSCESWEPAAWAPFGRARLSV